MEVEGWGGGWGELKQGRAAVGLSQRLAGLWALQVEPGMGTARLWQLLAMAEQSRVESGCGSFELSSVLLSHLWWFFFFSPLLI